jgi:hypothetical protein
MSNKEAREAIHSTQPMLTQFRFKEIPSQLALSDERATLVVNSNEWRTRGAQKCARSNAFLGVLPICVADLWLGENLNQIESLLEPKAAGLRRPDACRPRFLRAGSPLARALRSPTSIFLLP